MAELANALDLGSNGEFLAGSSPVARTKGERAPIGALCLLYGRCGANLLETCRKCDASRGTICRSASFRSNRRSGCFGSCPVAKKAPIGVLCLLVWALCTVGKYFYHAKGSAFDSFKKVFLIESKKKKPLSRRVDHALIAAI